MYLDFVSGLVVTKCILKQRFFTFFVSFLAQLLNANFLSHLLMLFCEVVGARRAPNEGSKGPPMHSAGARRKGP